MIVYKIRSIILFLGITFSLNKQHHFIICVGTLFTFAPKKTEDTKRSFLSHE